MCELNAQFIEGRSPFIPGCYATTVAEETIPIIPYLALLNRSGVLTTCSHPGVIVEGSYEQRAFVDGFASETTAQAIARGCQSKDLYVGVYGPGQLTGGPRLDVSREAMRPYTWTGNCDIGYELYCFRDHCNEQAMEALRSAHYISVIDLKWGRNNLLWDQLVRCLMPVEIDDAHFCRVADKTCS